MHTCIYILATFHQVASWKSTGFILHKPTYTHHSFIGYQPFNASSNHYAAQWQLIKERWSTGIYLYSYDCQRRTGAFASAHAPYIHPEIIVWVRIQLFPPSSEIQNCHSRYDSKMSKRKQSFVFINGDFRFVFRNVFAKIKHNKKFWEELIASFHLIRQGPHRRRHLHPFFVATGTCLPSRCLATIRGDTLTHTDWGERFMK
jgi:hypothetical protein